MVSRSDVVAVDLPYNGWGNGQGYPGERNNPACDYLGRPWEYSCADGVTFAFKKAGLALPVMQAGLATGYAYCPSGLAFARDRHAVIGSWQVQPADIIFVNTGSGSQPGHTELVVWRKGSTVRTFGWDSGPSNVDGFIGQGGCHLHDWECPEGVGNPAIMAAVDAGKLVHFGSPARHHQPAKPGSGHGLLMLKSPLMHGSDVKAVQEALLSAHIKLPDGADGVYGEHTAAAVEAFQKAHHLAADGIVGPATRKELGL